MQSSIPKKIHFIGIGGAGMSALAHILIKTGRQVTGSDQARNQVVEKLESQGANCFKGHRPENIDNAELVVVSTAIPETNPELIEAKKKDIPIVHRGELLAMLMKCKLGLAVSGAHGKTTTTSMLATVLEKNELDPIVLIGGELTEIGGNAKFGTGKYLVAEADESDGSFLKLLPYLAIITNIEDDHLDYYGDITELKSAFKVFLNQVSDSGVSIACIDDPNVREVLNGYSKNLITYGVTSTDADYTVREITMNGSSTGGYVYFKGEYQGELRLAVPGRHNLSNALAVVAAGQWLGIPFSGINEALQSFKGAGRRFQLLGDLNGVKVIDDYAHHPSEVKATLQAAKQINSGRIVAVFQPHRYTRTSLLYEQFGRAFKDADEILINEVYSAGELPIEGVDSSLITGAIKKNGQYNVKYYEHMEEIVEYLEENSRPGDVVLTMGAGNIWSVGTELVKRLKEKNQ